ncbi:MAG: prolipoprotein diacylglyceryl transferase [Thiohalomonadales bacterium]
MRVDFDQVAFSIFGLSVHWYGISYLVSFILGWQFLRWQSNKNKFYGWTPVQADDFLFYAGLGVILGGRLGYVLFYNFSVFLDNPIMLLQVWKGGMSFHGGFLGVMLAIWFFARKTNKRYFDVVDFVAPAFPIGLFFGRLANFVNGELWGKESDVPWAMIFPRGGEVLRHPNPLYEAFLEGVVMFIVLYLFSQKQRRLGVVSAVFALMYSTFRFLIEFIRVPDAHLGYLGFGWLTMGQILSIPLFLVGVLLLWLAYREKK